MVYTVIQINNKRESGEDGGKEAKEEQEGRDTRICLQKVKSF